MLLKDMFKKTTYIPIGRKEDHKETFVEQDRRSTKIVEPHIPEGLWTKCEQCGSLLYTEDVINDNYTCSKCGSYFRINADTRISMLIDKNTFEEWDTGLDNKNPLNFPGYDDKIDNLRIKTNLDEAVITGKGCINGKETVIGVCDSRFLMGSMGHVVGEKITRTIEKATELKLPVILYTCSGGARMQEGIVSLMQMAKTSAALKKHSDAGLLYITVLTDPTTGGVTASFAMLGDIILAEPGALIGFAGPRVIEQTIGQKLPEGFQKSEFLLEHGFVDKIVKREEQKDTLSLLISMHENTESKRDLTLENEPLEEDLLVKNDSEKLTAWDIVSIARSSERPTSLDYIQKIFTDFTELHGDRQFRDDGAIVGGIAYLNGCPVTVIGQQKGKNTKENIVRNFGMPYPEGYRKALRLMKQAEKFNRPIINFIDTPGAFCGLEAEERGQGEAIARNLMEMSGIEVPILSIVIGEGGSGGALALGVGNEVWMMENAVYSILSPEGFASILWKDSKRAKEAADIMKITATDLKALNIIDKIIPEGNDRQEGDFLMSANTMKENITRFLRRFSNLNKEEILNQRYDRFRRM